jgi:hypothetical protein
MKNQTIATVAIFGLGLIAQSAQAQQWGVPIPQPGYANSTPAVRVQPLPQPAPQIRQGGQVDVWGNRASGAFVGNVGRAAGAFGGGFVTGPMAPAGATVGGIAGGTAGTLLGQQAWPLVREGMNGGMRMASPQTLNANGFYTCSGYPGQMFRGGCPR